MRDIGMCRICEAHGVELHVHHLTYERVGKENLKDLVTLCRRCHTDIHQRAAYDKQELLRMKDDFEQKKYEHEAKHSHRQVEGMVHISSILSRETFPQIPTINSR